MSVSRVAWHLALLANYVFSMWYDVTFVDIPFLKREGDMKFMNGRLKFLTIWNMLLQALFFSVCVLNDLIGSNDDEPTSTPPLIRKIKDLLLACLAFPISMFVGLTFWGLYAVDRELVFPKALDEFFPVWLNHVMHTNIMIFILLEMYSSFRRYPTRKVGMSVLGVFMVTYLVWVHVIYAYSGMWVYPVLEVLNLPARIVFFLTLLGLAVSLYIMGEKLNTAIWGSVEKKQSREKLS